MSRDYYNNAVLGEVIEFLAYLQSDAPLGLSDLTRCEELQARLHAEDVAQGKAQPACIGEDPTCPCQDGDSCHYVDTKKTKAWPVKAQPGEPDDSRDEVGEVGEFGGVTFFKELKPNTLLFTRPWLDSEIEKSRMEADGLCAKLNIEREPDPAVVEAAERLHAAISDNGWGTQEEQGRLRADLETILKGRGC